MSPATLLQLWRDRWHKPRVSEDSVPLVHGRIARWTMDLARSNHWEIPGLSAGVAGICMVLLGLGVTTHLSTNSQIVLGWTLIMFAVYLRRHRGQVVALAIVGMSMLLTLRYFNWRLDATLPHSGILSMALALALLSAEALTWLRAGLHYGAAISPLEHPSALLPEDPVLWPTIDHLILLPQDGVDRSAQLHQLPPFEWPANKVRTIVIAASFDAAVAEVCSARGFDFRFFPECSPVDPVARINRALYELQGELLLISECGAQLPVNLLRQSVGWFVQEPLLALTHAPTCFLTPSPPELLKTLTESTNLPANTVLARRSCILDIGGFCMHSPTARGRSCKLLDHAGFFSAYLLGHKHGEGIATSRLDAPFRPFSLAQRVGREHLRQALDFYAPLFTGVFFIVPVGVIVGGLTPISSDLFSLSAYWLPHWVLGRLALATALEHHRLRWIDFLREELGALAVLLRTAKSFSKTWFRQHYFRHHGVRPATSRLPRAVALTPRADGWATALFFTALTGWAVYRWPSGPSPLLPELYASWSALLALMVFAELAVQREMDWVWGMQIANQRLPAMLTLSSGGRVLRATTVNFPELPLRIALPPSSPPPAPQTAHLTLFLGHREFGFICVVGPHDGVACMLTIAPDSLGEYRQFAAMVFSRPADWPMWLAPAHANQLLPGWLARWLTHLQDAFYNLAVKSAAPALWQKFRVRFFPGKSTHG